MKSNRAETVKDLIDQYGKMVFSTAYRILGSAEDAEDALQEVFLKVLGKWNGSLKPDSVRDWGAYLRVVASRSAIDMLRRDRNWIQQIEEKMEEVAAPDQPNPRNIAIQHQKAKLLREALRKLRGR